MSKEPDPRLVALGLVPPAAQPKEEPSAEEDESAYPSAPQPSGTDMFPGMGKFTGTPPEPTRPVAAPPAPTRQAPPRQAPQRQAPPRQAPTPQVRHDAPAVSDESALPPGFVAPSPSKGPTPLYKSPGRPAQPRSPAPAPLFSPSPAQTPVREATPPPPLAAVMPTKAPPPVAPPVAQPVASVAPEVTDDAEEAQPVPARRERPARPRRRTRAAATQTPKAPPPPKPAFVLPQSAVLLKEAITMGFPEKEFELTLEQLGFRIDTEEKLQVAWSDVKEIKARRGRVAIRTKSGGKPIAFMIAIDGVGEPTLAGAMTRLVKEASGGKLDLAGSAVLELRNGADLLRDRYHDEDDPIVPALVGAIFGLAGVVLTSLLPDALAMSARTPYAAGAFLIDQPLAVIDPRIFVTSFAGAAVLAAGVIRLAMGKTALAWALGTLRGWHEGARPAVDTARRVLALIIVYPSVAAALLLAGIVLALPSLRVQTIIDAGGFHFLRPVPIFDDDKTWQDVADVKLIPAPTSVQHPEGVVVLVRFANGGTLSTVDGRLRGGTDKQLFTAAQGWREEPK